MSTTTTLWALGDYEKVADDILAGLGRDLVAACGVGPGTRVLDVATGTGNAAIPAAGTGASVVACDITPELMATGAARNAAVEWVEGDAQDLPFPDASFDVVMSCIGAMFAPDHERTAHELLRVCRPGGTIGMFNWTPEGWAARFFDVFGAPEPPAPVEWGREAHVRELLGGGVDTLELERATLVVDHFATPRDLCDYYAANFGPVVAAYAAADDPAALDRAFLAFVTETDQGGPDGPAIFELEYLRVIARTPAAPPKTGP
jgi:ubiquinone/menaquinone biosynthesis C-methylase UbiE